MNFLPALVWVALSWHGGLHPWQQAAAALLLAVFVWGGRSRFCAWSDLGATERVLGWLVLAVACETALSMRPQTTLNAAAGLGLALMAAVLIRRQPGTQPRRVAGLLMYGGAWFAVAFAIGGLYEWIWNGDTVDSAVTVARWLFPNQNLLAAGLLVPALLLGLTRVSASRIRAAPAGLCVAVSALALVYAGSRGAYLALAVGSLWLLLRWGGERRRLAGWTALALATVAALALWAPFSRLAVRVRRQASPGLEDANYSRRTDFWKGAADLSLERPLGGHGLGAFGAAAYGLDLPTALTPSDPVARYRLSLDHAHNDWLELAVETGWPVTLALALCALAWMLRRWRSDEGEPDILGLEAVVVAAGALSLVDMNLRTPALAWGLVLCFCAIEAKPAAAPTRMGGLGKLALAIALVALLCLGGTVAGWSFRRYHGVGRSSAVQGSVALWLQPLDAGLAAAARGQGLSPWPWSAWAGRQDPGWWWNEAMRAGVRTEQEADARRAVALRPYFAPGWYWLGQKLAQDGERAAASRAMDRALKLEPNFCRVLAWQAEQAGARGDTAGAHRLAQRVFAIRALHGDSPDDYSSYIQSLDAAWLAGHGAKTP